MGTYTLNEIGNGSGKKTYSLDEVMSKPVAKYDAIKFDPTKTAQGGKDMLGGVVGSAGGIGATLAQPFQWAAQGSLGNNADMRKNMEANIKGITGANKDSTTYKTTKLLTDIALTAPVGGLVGNGAKALGAEALGNSIASGGFQLGNTGGNAVVNGLTRIAGGAINGGTTAGLINPSDTGTGAFIGGAIPIAGKVGYEAFKLGGKALAPFTEAGRESLLTDNLIQMLGDKSDRIAYNLSKAKGNTAGFNPTVGQAGDSAELSAFERMFKNRNAGLFQQTIGDQNKALADAANSLGGSDLDRAALVAARSKAVDNLYTNSQADMIESSPELESLFKRPAIADALNAVKLNAANRNVDGIVSDRIINGALYQDGAPEYLSSFSRPDLMQGDLISGATGKNVVQQVRKMGGVNINQILDITGEKTGRAARAPVGFFHKNGLGADDLAQQLDSLGYIPHEEMQVDGGVQYVKNAIQDHLGGNKTYALDDAPLYAPNYFGTKTINHANSNGVNGVGDYSVNPVYSGKTLQEIKFALDAAKKFNPMASTGERMTQAGVFDASNAYNKFLSENIPDMRKADALFSDMSKPINQLDIGNEIRDRFIPAQYRDLPIPSQLNRANLAKIYQDTGDQLAKKVTGFKGSTLENSLSGQQKTILSNLIKDNQMVNAGEMLGKGSGSPTYQHLTYSAKGENGGLLDKAINSTKLISNTAKLFSAAREAISHKSLDAQMATMLQNPNVTGQQIANRLQGLSLPKPVINEILNKYGLLQIPSVVSAQ